jgi:HlyD family secretion protein
MRSVVFVVSFLGLLAAGVLAYVSTIREPSLPPAFTPAINPYVRGIYANGILESDQPSGSNITLYPEVPGRVRRILVSEGQVVDKGTPLLDIDDSTQRATVGQLQAQARAAFSVLEELRAQPRPEALRVAEAQLVAAEAVLKTAQDALERQRSAFERNPKAVSKDTLDRAVNAAAEAKANVDVARTQRDLTRAGAWTYDIDSQEQQYEALLESVASASALLEKYGLVAPGASKVLAINTTVGGFVSPQGAYDIYTQSLVPVMVLGTDKMELHVRCYVDEILVPRLPDPSKMKARMSIRGSQISVPLEYVRTQPLVSPKIQLSNQRQERVDVRVLPIVFRFEPPPTVTLYAGQLVDVYIGE